MGLRTSVYIHSVLIYLFHIGGGSGGGGRVVVVEVR